VQWMLHRVFRPPYVIRVAALDPAGYSRADWWKHDGEILAFEMEVLKYLYYRVSY
jgi:hypothetical protein